MKAMNHGVHSRMVLGVLGLLALSACSDRTEPTTRTAPTCNRQCLLDTLQGYVAALVAHDVSKAPLAADIAFVENVTKLKPGEGLWQTIVKGPEGFAIPVPDETTQSVGYLAVVTWRGPAQAPQGASPEQRAEFARSNPPVEQPAIIAIRLKLDTEGRIAEAEHLVSAVREPQMVNLQTLRPGILSEIPQAQRRPHDELIRIGLSYYDALDDNNGDLSPFAADCERHENGMITASSEPSSGPTIPGAAAQPKVARDCRGQLSTNTFQYIDRIDNRRVFAADPQTGLVMGLSHFRHPMTNLPYQVKALDGSLVERNRQNMPFAPFDLPAAHIYKVGPDGLIHEIEAMGFITVLNSPTGWE